MDKTLLFWILVGGLSFGFALALQMRMITALVLRRALKAWREDYADRAKANAVVVAAASQAPAEDEAVAYMQATYPSPLAHLRAARRYSVILPALLVGVLALGRLVWGVI